jgi:hypothetical protein
MELIEGSETSAISIVTPGNYPKENILHTGHGESLKSRTNIRYWTECLYAYVADIIMDLSRIVEQINVNSEGF